MSKQIPHFIITARIGSHRLPQKVIKDFWKDYSILEFLIVRLKDLIDQANIILSIPDSKENDQLEIIGVRQGIGVERGSEQNVLERMTNCLKDKMVNYVGRITADNPFTDPNLLLLQWRAMQEVDADYSYCKTSPVGTSADIWTIECFNSTGENAKTQYELEHVNAWVWDHPDRYKVLWFQHEPRCVNNSLNLSIDTFEDYVRLKEYSKQLVNPLKAGIKDFSIFMPYHKSWIEKLNGDG